jgi:hypothetical protein
MCGGCELMWSGGVVRHRVSEQRSWHRFGQTQKMTTAAVYAGHFGVSLPLFFLNRFSIQNHFLNCYWAGG